jgi:peptidyl-prolyl cis-trans isomerase C
MVATGCGRPAQPVQLNLFGDLASKLQESFREVSVQHILVPSQMRALELYEALAEEGATPQTMAEYAREHSSCGSAKKTPTANLPQLRGIAGELSFRRGQMAPEFEEVAFNAPVGEVQRPVQTQFGWHVILVNKR